MERNFQACLRHVFAMEGGFSNDPSDHGGATNWGITAATLAHWRGHKVTEADVRAIPPEEARAIYQANDGNAVRGTELPGGVDLVVFDVSVNSGPGRAVKMLQSAVRCNQVDGIFGPATKAAVGAMPAAEIVSALDRARRRFYAGLVERDPSQGRFLAGWINRVAATSAAAKALLCPTPHAAGPIATASSSEAIAAIALNSS